jgi:hypothetical protein
MGYISINIIIFMEKGIFSFSGFFLFKILTFFAKSPKPFFYVLLCIGHLLSVEFSVASMPPDGRMFPMSLSTLI